MTLKPLCASCVAVILTAALAGCGAFSSTPAPERRVLVPCPVTAPPVSCPPLPVLQGAERRVDAQGQVWLDVTPDALLRAWLDAEPGNVQCRQSLKVWEDTHATCLAATGDGG